MGQQWPAVGAGVLTAADLGHVAYDTSPLGGGHHQPYHRAPEKTTHKLQYNYTKAAHLDLIVNMHVIHNHGWRKLQLIQDYAFCFVFQVIFNDKGNILLICDVTTIFFWLIKNEFRGTSLGFGNKFSLWVTCFDLKYVWHISISQLVNSIKVLLHLNNIHFLKKCIVYCF